MNVLSGAALPSSVVSSIPRHGFEATRVLVVGDLMLDRYILGDVNRLSPEAPVPVLAIKGQRATAGGAANVALNVAGLNARALLAGVVGEDTPGHQLMNILTERRIDVSGIVTDSTRPTTCKTRVMCGNHQIVRMDEESSGPLEPATLDRLFENVVRFLDDSCHAVIMSDYAKGVLSADFTHKVIQACVSRQIPVLVDPKRSNYGPYKGATCITPNLKEFKEAAAAVQMDEHADMSAVGLELLTRIQSQTLLVTQGAAGMTLFTGGHSYHCPALAEEVFDVSGAGDTVISTIATALAAGLDMLSAVQLSNIAAGLVVRRTGTAPIDWDDLAQIIFQVNEQYDPVSSFDPIALRRMSAS